MKTGPVKIIRRDTDQIQPLMFTTSDYTDTKLSKKEALTRLVNLDKVRDLIRKSSREKRQETAKEVRDSKGKFMTRTKTLLNLKENFFEMKDNKLTPIVGIDNAAREVTIVDDTLDDIKELLSTMN